MNINVVKLSLNGKSLSLLLTCVAFHLSRVACEIGSQKFYISCLSISILLSHIGKILVLSLLFAQGGHWQHVHPGILEAFQGQ